MVTAPGRAPAALAAAGAGNEESPLAAIFYADFHNVSGRKIVHQYPPEKFTKPHYKMLSSRIISDKPFCEKVTVIDSMAIPWTLASFPSSISDVKYDRGIFSYNISFVFKKGHPHTPRSEGDDGSDKMPFVKVLERLGWWLREMELRFGYLYGGEGSKVRLRECLGRVYKGIKTEGRAWLMMTGPGCPSMMLLLQPYLACTPSKNWREIQDHDVPVRRCAGLVESVSTSTSALMADPEAVWGAEVDMVVQQVLPHVNGVKHVKKISRDSQVEIAAVKGALQWVLYTNQILLTDVFRYGNVYVQTATTEGECLRVFYARKTVSGVREAAEASAVATIVTPRLVPRRCGRFRLLHGCLVRGADGGGGDGPVVPRRRRCLVSMPPSRVERATTFDSMRCPPPPPSLASGDPTTRGPATGEATLADLFPDNQKK